MNASGGKRPAPPEGYAPRKRAAAEEDDFPIEEDFDLEPPEDEDELGLDMEVQLLAHRATSAAAAARHRPAGCQFAQLHWQLGHASSRLSLTGL